MIEKLPSDLKIGSPVDPKHTTLGTVSSDTETLGKVALYLGMLAQTRIAEGQALMEAEHLAMSHPRIEAFDREITELDRRRALVNDLFWESARCEIPAIETAEGNLLLACEGGVIVTSPNEPRRIIVGGSFGDLLREIAGDAARRDRRQHD